MIKLRDLEYLNAVSLYKHFGRAAESCFVSQPTLSGQLMKLEQQLGLQLVERHRKNVMLTPAGEKLILEARNVLRAVSEFEASAKSLHDPLAGDLHIGLIPTLAPYLLPHIIADLNEKLPRIKFFLHEDKTSVLLDKLNGGSLDVLVLPWLSDMENVERYDLFEEPLVLATHNSHPLAKRDNVALSDLNGLEILNLEDGHCLRDQAMGYCFAAGADEDHRFKATSLETLRYMVASDMGITLLPSLAIKNQSSNQAIKYTNFIDPKPVRQISLLIRPNYSRMQCVREVVTSISQSIAPLI